MTTLFMFIRLPLMVKRQVGINPFKGNLEKSSPIKFCFSVIPTENSVTFHSSHLHHLDIPELVTFWANFNEASPTGVLIDYLLSTVTGNLAKYSWEDWKFNYQYYLLGKSTKRRKYDVLVGTMDFQSNSLLF